MFITIHHISTLIPISLFLLNNVNALATLAVAGTAFAQSSVTLSGAFGAGVQKAGTAGAKAQAAFTDASVKFTATEDLGGGLKATVASQLTMNGTRGGNVTKEDSSVSLAGGFGDLSVVNTRSTNAAVSAAALSGASLPDDFYAYGDSDAGGNRYGLDGVSYTTTKMNGFTANVARYNRTTALDAINAATSNTDTINVVGVSYANGPLSASVASKKNNGASTSSTVETQVTYDAGVVKASLGYVAPNQNGVKRTGLGVAVPMGAMTLGLGYVKANDGHKYYDVAAVYSLSKRTAINASFGKSDQANENQYRIKLIQSF